MTPMVLLHGIPTDPRLWTGVVAALDRRGHPTVTPRLPWARWRRREDWRAWARDTLPRGAVLVGHDLGGLVAAEVADELDAACLVLSSTALGLGWLGAWVGAWPPLHRLWYHRHGGTAWLRRGVAPAAGDALVATFGRADPEAMVRVARALPVLRGHGLRPRTPTLLLWGAADRSVSVPYARLLAGRLGAPLVLLPGLRHYAMWEAPEAYAAALVGWAGPRPGSQDRTIAG